MSKRTDDLDAQVQSLRAELLEISEAEEPTEEQIARSDAALAEYEAAEAELVKSRAHDEQIEKIRSAAQKPANVERSFAAPNVIVRTDPFENLDAVRHMDPNSEEVVSRALAGVTELKHRGISNEAIEEAVNKIETVPGAARYALAVGSPAYRSAFSEMLRAGGPHTLNGEQADAVRTSMSLTSAAGGYALPFLLDPTVIHTGTATNNPIRKLARVETGTQNVWHGVTVGNVSTAWKGEGSAFTDGSPTFGGPTVTAAMLTAYVTASFEIFQDTNLQGQLTSVIAESIDFKEGTAFITGSGSTAPKGIITAVSGTAASLVTCTTRGQFDSASSADVFAVVNAAAVRYENSSTWVSNKVHFNSIRRMSTAGNGSLFWTDLNTGTPPSLLGSPTVSSSDVPSAVTSGTHIAILGDFKQFVIYDRIGVNVEFIANVVDGSGIPTGQRGLVAYKRVGSDVTDVDAFRLLKT